MKLAATPVKIAIAATLKYDRIRPRVRLANLLPSLVDSSLDPYLPYKKTGVLELLPKMEAIVRRLRGCRSHG
jgi:hypothetical protein